MPKIYYLATEKINNYRPVGYMTTVKDIHGTFVFSRPPDNFDVTYRTDDVDMIKPVADGKYYCVVIENPLNHQTIDETIRKVLGDDYEFLVTSHCIVLPAFRSD